MRILKNIFCCILFFGFCHYSFGQTSDAKYNLSSNYIESISYDRDGKLWIGTDEGLNLITSHDQYQFLADISDEKGILDSEIFKLNDLKNGNLAAFSINGLSIFNPNEFNFKQIALKSKPVSIHFDINTDSYWITTEESGIVVIDDKFEIKNDFSFDPLNPLSVSSSRFTGENKIVFNDQNAFVGTGNGFNIFNKEQQTFKRFYSGKNGLDSNVIIGIFKLDKDSLLVATANKIFLFDILSEKFEPLNLEIEPLDEIIQISTNEFFLSSESSVYSIQLLNDLSLKKELIHSFKSKKSARFKKLEEGILIFNQDLDYILKFDTKFKSISKYLVFNNINAVEKINSRLIIGTDLGITEKLFFQNIINTKENDEDLFFYDNKYNNETRVYKSLINIKSNGLQKSFSIPKSIAVNRNTLFEINDDYLFIFDNKLHVFDFSSRSFETNLTTFDDYLKGEITSIKLIDKHLYLSTGNGIVGINVKKSKNPRKSFRSSIEKFEYNNLLNNEVPKSFSDIEKVGNYFFVGSENDGLSLYKNDFNQLIKKFDYEKGNPRTLSSKSIVKIFNDDLENQLLLATRGSGLFTFNLSDSLFTNYNSSDGLLSNNINDFAKIDGKIWIQSGNGLNFFENGVLRNINPDDGIKINSFHKESIHKLEEKIFLTGYKNLQTFNPNEIKKFQSYKLKVGVLNITGYDDENTGRIITKSDSLISIDNGVSSLELNLFTNASNKNNLVQYSYKTSFGEKIIEVDNFKNKIKLNSLPFYDSQIQIFAKDGNGNKNSNTLILNFYNTPPWWLRTETIIFYVVFGIISIYLIVKLRENQTKKRIEGERKSKELEEARNLQNSLLPKINPEVDGYQISTFLKSATEIGGDYYDFFYEKGKYFYAICGDATGHGVISGIMVSVTKAALSGIPMSSPSKILEQLNGIVKKVNFGRLRMSLSVAKINEDTIELSSAAMPPTYYFNSKKNNLEEILVPNLPLGGIQREKFDGIKLNFKKGDLIVMISDGLPELPNPNEEILDYEKVEQCLKNNSKKGAEEIKDALVNLSEEWSNGILNPDDITIVVIKKAA